VTRDSRRSLRPEELARIARLEVRAREVVEGFLTGMHRSPYFGNSIEFLQHREYVPGDETRHIDWKVWSKTDRYYVKLYEEETNLRTILLVDASESMQFGSGAMTKFDYGCTIAAALTYLLLKQQDSVGLVTFDAAVRNVVPPRSKQTHLTAVLSALSAEQPRQKTDIHTILRRVAEDYGKRGMIVLISDLLADRDGLFRGLKLLRHRGHDVLVFHVLDDQELDFDYSGTTRFEGLEELGELTCDPRALREGYLEALQAYLNDVRRECARNKIDYQVIRTSEHLDAALAGFLSKRLGMRHALRG
jgi:uncharacterized protein (DUF58 family)